MREPIATGAYYPEDPELLKDEIKASFTGQRGPSAGPLSRRNKRVVGIISPHSPYRHCGECMAWSYKDLGETPIPDVYIILSVNHYSYEAGISLETFSTPLGFVRVDQELGKAVIEKGHLPLNEGIHNMDPAIEVQLPYIQFSAGHEPERVKILPILLNPNDDVKEIAIDIKEALMDLGRNAIFIVSTNFTQRGPLFHHDPCPVNADVERCVKELDDKIFEQIRRQEPYGIPLSVSENDLKIDGWRAIELLLHIIPKGKVSLEQYFTSGDVLNDFKNTVSYAAFVFETE